MYQPNMLRLCRKLLTLSTLIACLITFSSLLEEPVKADTCEQCETAYFQCINVCSNEEVQCRMGRPEWEWGICYQQHDQCVNNCTAARSACMSSCSGGGGGDDPETCPSNCGVLYHACREYRPASECFPERMECLDNCPE